MKRPLRLGVVLLALGTLLVPSAATAEPNIGLEAGEKVPPLSGIYEYRTAGAPETPEAAAAQDEFRTQAVEGALATDCPQAGLEDTRPQPLDTATDRQERISRHGDDIRVNQDFSCFPQNETSVSVNPTNPDNIVAGANDYRLGWGSSGFYASTDGGESWYDGILPFPSLPTGDNLDGGGDPIIVFDRNGTAYYGEINFNRTDDTNGLFVLRSTNGGFTWSRPCVPVPGASPTDDVATCGPVGDPRQPGDGVVSFFQDPTPAQLNGDVPFEDKPWLAIGPRPAGVQPVCFGAETKAQQQCAPGTVAPDRLYMTWTRFGEDSQIYLSYSDDGARSWSPPVSISGSAPFCVGGGIDDPNACNFNQFSVPTISPVDGSVYVAWQNFNAPDENQYVMRRSTDGGATFGDVQFVSSVYDVNYPRSGLTRPDCTVRGQQTGRAVLTNSCFRVNSGGNIVVDKRGGAFADDLYLVFSDNRNGTAQSSNVDVFLFTSPDGGETWVGPTRVNDDRSEPAADRDCEPGTEGCLGDFGTDQWFPWADINTEGELNVVFNDRRNDTDSVASEWPESRSQPGNYLAWLFGAQCQVTQADGRQCVAAEAEEVVQPTEPVDPGPNPVPGQAQASFPLRNLQVSDHPSNYDYSFRAGIFMGDYNNVYAGEDDAYAFWTDTRNGRSSRSQVFPGRNPACEQSDVWLDMYDARRGGGIRGPRPTDDLFLVMNCP